MKSAAENQTVIYLDRAEFEVNALAVIPQMKPGGGTLSPPIATLRSRRPSNSHLIDKDEGFSIFMQIFRDQNA